MTNARFVHLDVTDEDAWADALAVTVDTFGRVDVLVNNAAVHHIVKLEDETVEGFERLFRVNLLGTFLGMRTCAPELRKTGHGSIVNISSAAGMVGFFGHGAYGASKWGVRGLTKVAAMELGPEIRVNSVHPGPIETDMLPMGPSRPVQAVAPRPHRQAGGSRGAGAVPGQRLQLVHHRRRVRGRRRLDRRELSPAPRRRQSKLATARPSVSRSRSYGVANATRCASPP